MGGAKLLPKCNCIIKPIVVRDYHMLSDNKTETTSKP